MADEPADQSTPITREEIREIVSEEVGRAIQASIPEFLGQLQDTLLRVVEEKIQEMGRNKTVRKAYPYDKFMACKPRTYDGEVNPIECQRWVSKLKKFSSERTVTSTKYKVGKP